MSTTVVNGGAGVEPTPEAIQHVFQLISGHIVASCMNIAARLTIADRLAAGPRAAADLARDCGVNEDALYRLLRTLASLGVFQEVSPRTFALNAEGAALRDGPIRWMTLWLAGEFNFRVYANAMHSVKTGESAVPVTTGYGAFETFARDPELSKVFNDAMTGFSAAIIPSVLQAYDFSGIGTLVDVAGGHGGILTAVLEKYPSMRGILFDLDHVIEGARTRIASLGLSGRCTTASGDFFRAVPAGGDAYIMKHIIHDWDDDKAAAILRNIRAVLPESGRVILLEAVIQDGGGPDLGKIIDIEMLVMPAGRERTAEEFRALFARAGLELTRIVPTESPLSVIEGRR
jgi:O-methyltransferase